MKPIIILSVLVLLIFSITVLAVNRNSVSVEIEGLDPNVKGKEFVSLSNENEIGLVALGQGVKTGSKMKITSDYKNNEFYIVFSKNDSIRQSIESAKDGFMEHSFAKIEPEPRETIRYFLRLEYDKFNLTNRARWGSGNFDLIVKNKGTKKNPQINLRVLR